MSHKSPPEGTLEPPALHKSANNVQGNVQINVQGNVYKQCSRKCTFTIYTKEMFKEMSANNVQGNVHLLFIRLLPFKFTKLRPLHNSSILKCD